MRLHFETQGSGEPIVMLHGIFGSNANLGGIARLLESRFQLIRADLRNHGQSPHADSMSFQDMANDVLELLDSQGLDSAHIFGHSLGGKVCMEFALQHPQRVKKLVVGDISPFEYPAHHEVILDGLQAIDVENISSRGEADKQLAEYVDELPIRQFLLKNLVRDDAGFRWLLNLPVIVKYYDQLRGSVGDDQVYDGEALFIRGGNSTYIRDEDVAALKQRFPNAKIETIEGAGHWLHAEQPQKFAQLMAEFIESY